MTIAIVSGAAGLVGSAVVRLLHENGLDVIGLDNDLRSYFFGAEASTAWNRQLLERSLPRYRHLTVDIRGAAAVETLFRRYGADIGVVVHAAAQPSHDWAAREPNTDFSVNAAGTLNFLEATRKYAPDGVFIFTSTNKVYGDRPNALPLVEGTTRWELEPDHMYARHGIDEHMSIDQTTHSLFGASKAAADLMVQEYGRYFGMRTASFRGGCLTGRDHAGAPLHGFLSYLAKCAATGANYTVLGYKGKQVRDNLHAADLAEAFWHFYRAPRCGEVYNIGGGPDSNCSILEAFAHCEDRLGRPVNWSYDDNHRRGDHIWWISDTRKFRRHYPDWAVRYGTAEILDDILDGIGAERQTAV